MRATALSLALLVLVSARAFAADCDACMDKAMCVRHQKEQDDALREFARGKRSKDPMKRRAALDALGKLNDSHLNARSPDVAKAIADMLDDADSGLRMGALTYLKSNQHVETAKEEIGKVLDKYLPRISKPKPSGKSASSGTAGLEWENEVALCKEAVSAIAEIGGKDAAPYFIKVVDTKNFSFAVDNICKTTAVKSEQLVEAYLSRLNELQTVKGDEVKLVCAELAKAFASHTQFAEPLGEEIGPWLKKARAWWKEKKESYDPPPAPPEPDPK